MARILIADDEYAICDAFAELLRREGHTPVIASTGDEAVRMAATESPAMVFLDIQMPGGSGLDALRALHASQPALPVVLMTAHGTVHTAMEAMRDGAFDYLGKPLELAAIRRVLTRALTSTSAALPLPVTTAESDGLPLGRSAAMQQIFKLMGLLADNDLTVLITGESGTGKELVARGIHALGVRRTRPFIAVNCAAVPESLLESTFFGHEKGAFTGADALRVGRFEAAEDGTLFLDEISELPHALQSKLLRVLQEKTFERVGSVRAQPLRARIIASTNRRLDVGHGDRAFRDDLYYRLNLVNVNVPPLRARRDDIAELVLHFLAAANTALGKRLDGIDLAAMRLLEEHTWPGNVRELEHTIKRSALTARGARLGPHDIVIDQARAATASEATDWTADLDRAVRTGLAALAGDSAKVLAEHPFQQLIEQVERTLVDEALRRTGGNQVAASVLLGVNRTTLRRRMRS